MEALIFTLGMLVRSIFFLLPSIEKWDFLKALGALSVSALIAGQSGADPILMPVFFLFLTAFLFRARLVPRVTKHLLLIYAVIALLLFVSKIYENNWLFTFADVFWGILIIPLTLFVTIASFS